MSTFAFFLSVSRDLPTSIMIFRPWFHFPPVFFQIMYVNGSPRSHTIPTNRPGISFVRVILLLDHSTKQVSKNWIKYWYIRSMFMRFLCWCNTLQLLLSWFIWTINNKNYTIAPKNNVDLHTFNVWIFLLFTSWFFCSAALLFLLCGVQ